MTALVAQLGVFRRALTVQVEAHSRQGLSADSSMTTVPTGTPSTRPSVSMRPTPHYKVADCSPTTKQPLWGLSGTLTVLHHPKCINGLGRLMVELTERMMTADGVSILDSRFQIVD